MSPDHTCGPQKARGSDVPDEPIILHITRPAEPAVQIAPRQVEAGSSGAAGPRARDQGRGRGPRGAGEGVPRMAGYLVRTSTGILTEVEVVVVEDSDLFSGAEGLPKGREGGGDEGEREAKKER